jgi:hypothetical protein
MKKSQKKRAKCPKCGAVYDMLDDAPIKAMGGLCAACWCDRHERNIREGIEREVGRSEKTTSMRRNNKSLWGQRGNKR